MHTFNGNPDLMLKLAEATRAGQLESADRRRARRDARVRCVASGFWGGLRHHRSLVATSSPRPV
jgi:hypothetical protein